MLANGTKLGYRTADTGDYTDLPGLKEIPDLGVDAEKVDNTCLTDRNKVYEMGIGDLPDMVYKFKYDNTSATSPYRVLRAFQDDNKTVYFKETDPDGTTFTFSAQVSVKKTGGGVNGVIECEATLIVTSEIGITDPA